MLDQNTDRMWFVIGAVIIGAASIFIANGTLPTRFASVSDSFEDTSDKGVEVIKDITRGMETYGDDKMKRSAVFPTDRTTNLLYAESFADMSRYQSEGVIRMQSFHPGDGIYLQVDDLDLKFDTKYKIRYQVTPISGRIYNIGGHTDTPFKQNTYYINGSVINYPYALPGGHSAYLENPPIELFTENKATYEVEVYIETPSSWEPTGDGKEYGGRLYIQINRGFPRTPSEVDISNIEVVEIL